MACAGDVEALQTLPQAPGPAAHGQSPRRGGKREVLANGKGSYVVLEGCGDRRQLKQIRRRIQNQMKGLDLFGAESVRQADGSGRLAASGEGLVEMDGQDIL